MYEFALRLKADPAWAQTIRHHQKALVHDTQVQQLLAGLWGGLKDQLLHDLHQEEPALQRHVQGWLEKLEYMLVETPGLRDWVNQSIEQGSAALIRQHRGEVGASSNSNWPNGHARK